MGDFKAGDVFRRRVGTTVDVMVLLVRLDRRLFGGPGDWHAVWVVCGGLGGGGTTTTSVAEADLAQANGWARLTDASEPAPTTGDTSTPSGGGAA